MARVATLCWSIWHHRNDVVWTDSPILPNQVGRIVYDAWNDWFTVHHLKREENYIFAPPTTDRVVTMGACFRDHEGNFVAGFAQRQHVTLSTVEGEAWALLQAMKKANLRGLNMVQFESDSQVLTEAIRTRRSGNSEFSLIVADIIKIMLSCINFEVKFVRRQANMVAHTLARATISWASFYRYEIIPLCIERLLVNEMH
ncbi:replication protein A 70 kDa DNA-binding subunit [Trifolium pratense]|uniref:Replication protein A 70 kDa DNA-binding subunit n=1 Tax=Trifolium pratense TaxID=57577 RepID=A0A2K3MXI7_TRIPR|nr:replication protein A 70 kDa DNA-binding subunit [Trifolium pratense]